MPSQKCNQSAWMPLTRDFVDVDSMTGSQARHNMLFNKLLHIRFVSVFNSLLAGAVVTQIR